MPRRRSSVLLAGIVSSSVLFAACGAPPTREMDQAQGAIDAARAAGADRYASDSYEAAVKALQSAHDAVAARDYRLALNHALDSRDRAQRAAKEGASQQVTLRSGAERRLAKSRQSSIRPSNGCGSRRRESPQTRVGRASRCHRRGGRVSAKSGHGHSGRGIPAESGSTVGICKETGIGDRRNRQDDEADAVRSRGG